MTKYAPKNKRFFLQWRFWGALAAVCFFLVVGTQQFLNYRSLKKQIADRNKQIAELEQNKKELMGSLSQYESDGFIEGEARNKLNLKKKGETVVVVKNIPVFAVEVEAKNIDAALAVEKQEKNLSLWWKYFFE